MKIAGSKCRFETLIRKNRAVAECLIPYEAMPDVDIPSKGVNQLKK